MDLETWTVVARSGRLVFQVAKSGVFYCSELHKAKHVLWNGELRGTGAKTCLTLVSNSFSQEPELDVRLHHLLLARVV